MGVEAHGVSLETEHTQTQVGTVVDQNDSASEIVIGYHADRRPWFIEISSGDFGKAQMSVQNPGDSVTIDGVTTLFTQTGDGYNYRLDNDRSLNLGRSFDLSSYWKLDTQIALMKWKRTLTLRSAGIDTSTESKGTDPLLGLGFSYHGFEHLKISFGVRFGELGDIPVESLLVGLRYGF